MSASGDISRAPARPLSFLWNWVGVVPFFLFALAFMLVPSFSILVRSFLDDAGNLTLANLMALGRPEIVKSYVLSIQVSLVTAIGGGLFGFLLAYAVTIGGLPKFARDALTTFSGVASNFAGVPLAFAFVAVLGRTGMITGLLKNFGSYVGQLTVSWGMPSVVTDWALTHLNFNIYDHGFNLYSFVGLSLTYMYFQFPLMVLVMAPALDGLKKEWREACENLGASGLQYWWYVALPILLPTLLGTMILLFGNAFGAYATAYALTGGSLPLVTIQIGAQIRGDVYHNPGLGYAMALGMVVIMLVSLVGYSWLQRQTERWLR